MKYKSNHIKFMCMLVMIAVLGLPLNAYAAQIKAQHYIMESEKDSWGILSLYASDNEVSQYGFKDIGISKSTYDHALLSMAVKASGRDASAYIEAIKGAQMKNGKFSDYVDRQGHDFVRNHIWSIIALYSAWDNDYDKSSALRWLKTAQNGDGGFPQIRGKESSVKTTAQAILAFKTLGMESEKSVQRALEYINSKIGHEQNPENIAWALMAKSNLGIKDEQTLERLEKYKNSGGVFSKSQYSGESDYMTTCVVLLAEEDYENEYSVFKKLHNADMFSDIKRSQPGYDAIMDVVNRGIASGYPDSTFRPQSKVTRAEFSKFLIYAIGFEDEVADINSHFKDMRSHWADSIVALAHSKGLVSGMNHEEFAPNENVTGAQIAAMLVRAKGLEGIAARFPGDNWYDGYVSAAKRRGLLYEGFDPDEKATRAQCAQAISRLY